MMGMIGNKILLIPLRYSKTSRLLLFMICIIAGWHTGVKLRVESRNKMLELNHTFFSFMWLLACQEGTILPPKAKQKREFSFLI